jgi:hypothetical protein
MHDLTDRPMPLEPDHDPDPQQLLPEDLRDDWAVVPRDLLYQVVLVGTLLGAGAALSIAGLVTGSKPMWYAFPVALLLAEMQRRRRPWSERRLLDALRERGTERRDGER